MQTPLKIIELSKNYDGKDAVKNISFNVNQNEIIGILGPNGCGKTTTIGMILGLLKPSKGKVLLCMSGGIDSSVAAMLLEEDGYDDPNVRRVVFNGGTLCTRPGCARSW